MALPRVANWPGVRQGLASVLGNCCQGLPASCLWPFLGSPGYIWARPQSRLYDTCIWSAESARWAWLSLGSLPGPAWVSQGWSARALSHKWVTATAAWVWMGFVLGCLCQSAAGGNFKWSVSEVFKSSVQVSLGLVSGRWNQPLAFLGSKPELNEGLHCQFNEGLRCQNFQNVLSEVQIDRTGSYSESGSYESWKKNFKWLEKLPRSGPKSASIFNVCNGRHVPCPFEPWPI